jgi:ADP-heptose:LPS heptosyltransferase
METVLETLAYSIFLTWLIASEDFITFSHHESINSYILQKKFYQNRFTAAAYESVLFNYLRNHKTENLG